MRLLLVEDDLRLAAMLQRGLRRLAYAADHAASLDEARRAVATDRFDLICIDRRLPDGDGLQLCREVRAGREMAAPEVAAGTAVRILMLTARDDVQDRIDGLDAGADDYLVKPFAFEELTARIRALLRRDRHGAAATLLTLGTLTVDEATRRVHRDGREISLTTREFAILRYLMHHPDEVVSAERLLQHVWDAHADPFTSSIRVLLSRLRRKLGPPPVIETVTGAGYRLLAS